MRWRRGAGRGGGRRVLPLQLPGPGARAAGRAEIRRSACPAATSRCPPTSRRNSASTSACPRRCINAYLGPLISRYVQRFGDEVRRLGIAAAPTSTSRTAAIISVAEAARHPVRTLLSGPGGWRDGRGLGRAAGRCRLHPHLRHGRHLDGRRPRRRTASPRSAPSARSPAIPVRIPDAGDRERGRRRRQHGLGRLGRRAARSGRRAPAPRRVPPATGAAARAATVTDANVVLGRLGARTCSTAAMASAPELADAARSPALADQLGASAIETAHGIVAVVQANMLGRHPRRLGPQGLRSARLHARGLRRRRPAARRRPGPRSRHPARAVPAGARHPLRARAAGRAAARSTWSARAWSCSTR